MADRNRRRATKTDVTDLQSAFQQFALEGEPVPESASQRLPSTSAPQNLANGWRASKPRSQTSGWKAARASVNVPEITEKKENKDSTSVFRPRPKSTALPPTLSDSQERAKGGDGKHIKRQKSGRNYRTVGVRGSAPMQCPSGPSQHILHFQLSGASAEDDGYDEFKEWFTLSFYESAQNRAFFWATFRELLRSMELAEGDIDQAQEVIRSKLKPFNTSLVAVPKSCLSHLVFPKRYSITSTSITNS